MSDLEGEEDRVADEVEPDEESDVAAEGVDVVAEHAVASDGAAEVAETSGTRRERLDSIVESLLFAAGAPLPLRRMVDVLKGPSAKEIKVAIERLIADYDRSGRGIVLLAVAGGFQFRTAPENAEWVRMLLRERPARLGRAALETLAIVAYKQPATRAEVEAIRGVDADSAISSLMAKRLIKIAGRKETVGRPLTYATTAEFLEVFGLKDLGELPALKEIGPAPEPEEDDDDATEHGEEWRALAEDLESRGDQLAADGGGDDPGGAGVDERAGGDGAGHEGDPEGSDRD